MNHKISIILIWGAILFSNLELKAQNVQDIIDKTYVLIENKEYAKGLELLRSIDENQLVQYGDSCVMMYNYEKGSSLYFTNKYEEAIPYLKEALLRMEKLPHEDCIYLELIYGIGACYNKLEQYTNAEKYFRRVIIRSNTIGFKCKITTQTLRDLTKVYKELGYSDLAKACAEKIESKVNELSIDNWSSKVDGLLDLAGSFEEQKRYDEEFSTYQKILSTIEANKGKDNDDYIVYLSIYSLRLIEHNRTDEAIPVLKEMIDIGTSLSTHNDNVCSAYENYISILSSKNNIEDINTILPQAIKYMKATPGYDWTKRNLYEVVGNNLFSIQNYEEGVKWLEKRWNGHIANSILALTNLGSYYYRKEPKKALAYFFDAEKQIENAANDDTREFIYENIMSLQGVLNNYKEAVSYAEKTATYKKILKDNDNYARHLIQWAVYCHKNGDKEKYEELFSEINKLMPYLSKETKAAYYSNKGYIYIGEKDYTESIKILREGISMVVDELGKSNKWLETMYHNLGRAYMLNQDYKNALLYLNKSKDLQIQLNGHAMQRTLDYLKECEAK